MKKSIIMVFISAILMITSACQVPSESELIEGNLQNIDELNGEMTVVTKDGEAITIHITKDTRLGTEDGNTEVSKVEVGSTVKLKTDKSNVISRKAEALSLPEGILPPLDSIEDVFKVLGVGEKAVELHEIGLTWSKIAWQLVDGHKMRTRLQQLAKERLEQAEKTGVITRVQSTLLFQDFDNKVEKWVRVIFSDVAQEPANSGKGNSK